MLDDQELLKFFSDGDQKAMDVLIRRYESSLFNLCIKLTLNRSDAEDLYQQMWLKALKKTHACSRSFKNWMYTICLNTYKDIYRRSKYKEMIGVQAESAMVLAVDAVSAETAAIRNLTKQQLIERINKLKDKHRIVLILYYFEGLEYKECAEVLGIPIGTVKSRLNAAKAILVKQMEDRLHV